jgi:FkbM family methyltransferase
MGLFPVTRQLYRQVSPSVRKENRLAVSFFRQLIQPGDPCFDVGANVGQTSEAMLGCGAKVVAVEPNSACYPVLDWQFEHDKRISIVKKAVGARVGTGVLYSRGRDPMASLRDDWNRDQREAKTVEVTTLDQLISEFGCPTFCKVDVEGYEVEVFQGLGRPIPVIDFEIHRAELDRARQVIDRLETIGRIVAAKLANKDHSGWLFEQWVPADELFDHLAKRAPQMGNLVVKMAVS